MPTTREIVSWVKLNANGWNRVGENGIIPIINEVQNMLMLQETHQQTIYNGEEFPSLTTQDGVFEYDINSTNVPSLSASDEVWRVAMMLLKIPVNETLRAILIRDYGREPLLERPQDKYRFNGKLYFRFLQVGRLNPAFRQARE